MTGRRGPRAACALLVTVALLGPGPAAAQQAAAGAQPQSAPPQPPPAPTQQPSGAPQQPPAPAQPPTAGAPGAPLAPIAVRLESADPAISFHMRHWDVEPSAPPGGPWAYFCKAPCQVGLLPGQHQLGVSYPGSPTAEVSESIDVTGPTTVTAYYLSRHDTRFGGWLLFWGSLIVGGAVSAASYQSSGGSCASDQPCVGTGSVNGAVLGVGIATGVVGMLAGLYFILQHDEAHVSVGPPAGPATPAPAPDASAAAPDAAPAR